MGRAPSLRAPLSGCDRTSGCRRRTSYRHLIRRRERMGYRRADRARSLALIGQTQPGYKCCALADSAQSLARAGLKETGSDSNPAGWQALNLEAPANEALTDNLSAWNESCDLSARAEARPEG